MTDQIAPSDVPAEENGPALSSTQAAQPSAKLLRLREKIRDADTELQALLAERDRLRAERREVQQLLGEQHGGRLMPRLEVEKTNGIPSFVVAQRMMQRVYRLALDPRAGLDGVGAALSDGNGDGTADFARSHGVPIWGVHAKPSTKTQTVIVHAFKGVVGLIEVHGPAGLKHFDSEGHDLGDIRPAASYNGDVAQPPAFADICSWANVLSANIPRPYVQVHFRCDEESALLDRVDVDPDRIPVLTTQWDERLGSLFDAAYSRFLLQPYLKGGLDNRVPGGTFDYKEAR